MVPTTLEGFDAPERILLSYDATGTSRSAAVQVCRVVFGRTRSSPDGHLPEEKGFGAEYVASALAAQGRRIIVVDEAERKDDLVQDVVDVLTSFCVRLYGRRVARKRAKKALEAAAHEG